MPAPAFVTPAALPPRGGAARPRVAPARRGPVATAAPSRAPDAANAAARAREPLLIRAARGEAVARPPVWLMRQAGRYMAEFRAYSDVQPFRQRSETATTAIELSLQPWRAYDVDAVIMFSDILTPLPALGRSFGMKPGVGPVLPEPLRTDADVRALLERCPLDAFDPATQLPFVAEILSTLRGTHLVDHPDTALLGFVGAPFTLAAYMIEGRGVKTLNNVKRFMFGAPGDAATPAGLHLLVSHLADAIAQYAAFQLGSGAHAVQLFESWAHHCSPAQYAEYGAPYAARVARALRTVNGTDNDDDDDDDDGTATATASPPVFYFANGSAGKLHVIRDHLADVADVLAVDWNTDMRAARAAFGDAAVVQGNADPAVLAVGSDAAIRAAARACVADAGGSRVIVNVGHGVMKETPEPAVGTFVDEIRRMGA